MSPTASVAQVNELGVSFESDTITLFKVTLPVLVTVTTYSSVSPAVISVELSASVFSVGTALTLVNAGSAGSSLVHDGPPLESSRPVTLSAASLKIFAMN